MSERGRERERQRERGRVSERGREREREAERERERREILLMDILNILNFQPDILKYHVN